MMSGASLSCRLACYAPLDEREALQHLASLGVRQVELRPPAPARYDHLRRLLDEAGMRVATLHVDLDLHQPAPEHAIERAAYATDAFDCRLLMTCVDDVDIPADRVYEDLRKLGDFADASDITLAVETHPELLRNGATGAMAMQAIGHPRIGVNFDTANFYFYNRDYTAGDYKRELKAIAPYVRAVHLKDTRRGLFHERDFPPPGQGIVDFPLVFRLLGAVGFSGPCTLEIPSDPESDDPRAVKAAHESAAAYLQSIGSF